MLVLPISRKYLTFCDYRGQQRTSSMIPMSRQKGLEVGFRNPHQPVEKMPDEKPLLDPAPDGAFGHADALGDFFDREELRR
jgi:hypothetical protein